MSTLPVETQVAPTVGSFTCGERCVEAEVFERATCALQVHGFFTEGLRAVGDELAQRGALVASRDARTMRRCLFEVGVVDGASGATVELSVADSGGALLDTLGFAIETPALFLGWGGPRPLVVVFRGEWVWSTLGSTWMSAPEAALRVVAWRRRGDGRWRRWPCSICWPSWSCSRTRASAPGCRGPWSSGVPSTPSPRG
ncbi:MAG: hypothetical protein ABIO70_23510 [Pseudomonadota bacterium]